VALAYELVHAPRAPSAQHGLEQVWLEGIDRNAGCRNLLAALSAFDFWMDVHVYPYEDHSISFAMHHPHGLGRLLTQLERN